MPTEITKRKIKILKYVNRHSGKTNYLALKTKFSANEIDELVNARYVYHNYIFSQDTDGFPIGSISDNALFFITDSGKVIVESLQWFNGQFVLTQILLPIAIAIITTLLTLFLSSLL